MSRTVYRTSPTYLDDKDIIIRPRYRKRERAVIMAHGANGYVEQFLPGVATSFPQAKKMLQDISEHDYMTMTSDLGGRFTFGNALAMQRVNDLRLDVLNGPYDRRILMFGGSMGGQVSLNYAARYPLRCAGVAVFAPAVDLDYLRDNNILGLATYIENAWNILPGQPLPREASPIYDENVAVINEHSIPVKIYYSKGDTIITEASVLAYAAKLDNVSVVKISDTIPHHDNLYGAIPRADLWAFLDPLSPTA